MIHRFYIAEEIPDKGVFILNNERIALQLQRVLKIKEGEKIVLFNGLGFDAVLGISQYSNRFVSGRIIEKIKNENDPGREVHLFQALVKKDNFEWILQKGTELGVKFFHPMLSERSIKTGVNAVRARRIIIEAIEQSGQDRIPQVSDVVQFREALTSLGPNATAVLFDRSGEFGWKCPLRQKRVCIFIGPEGGFSPVELEQARNAGCHIASMGPRIFRAETAAVVALSKTLTI